MDAAEFVPPVAAAFATLGVIVTKGLLLLLRLAVVALAASLVLSVDERK